MTHKLRKSSFKTVFIKVRLIVSQTWFSVHKIKTIFILILVVLFLFQCVDICFDDMKLMVNKMVNIYTQPYQESSYFSLTHLTTKSQFHFFEKVARFIVLLNLDP